MNALSPLHVPCDVTERHSRSSPFSGHISDLETLMTKSLAAPGLDENTSCALIANWVEMGENGYALIHEPVSYS